MSDRRSPFPLKNKLRRLVWEWAWLIGFRFTPRFMAPWRRFLLRLFGGRIGKGVLVYPTCKVWAPWNLEMKDFSVLGPYVDCCCADKITVGESTTVSQYTYLCSAGHSIDDTSMALVTAPIVIGDRAWVCADVFIAPGVTVGEGAVVGLRSSRTSTLGPWSGVTPPGSTRNACCEAARADWLASAEGGSETRGLPRPRSRLSLVFFFRLLNGGTLAPPLGLGRSYRLPKYDLLPWYQVP
jgi:putative colanic acid biosynthesis acetyltransferase WcaF